MRQFSLLLIALLTACRTIVPNKPIPENVNSDSKIERPISVIDIPVKIDFSSINWKSLMPERFYSNNFPNYVITKINGPQNDEHIDYRYDISPSTFDVSLQGNSIYLNSSFILNTCEAHGCLKNLGPNICPVAIDVNCHGGGANLSLVSNLTVTSNYSFSSSTSIQSIATDGCTGAIPVGGIPLGIPNTFFGPYLQRNLGSQLTNVIDQKIASFSFRQKANEIWELINRPIQLDSNVFLTLNPKGFRVSQINGNGKEIDFSLGLDATPEIVYGNFIKNEIKSLPPLEISSPGNAYNLYADFSVDYDMLNNAIEKELKKKRFDIDKSSYVEIDKCLISGQKNNKVVVKLIGKGMAKGIKVRKATMYLIGTPNLNLQTQEVSLSEIDYDISTKNIFLNFGLDLEKSNIRNLIKTSAKASLSKPFINIKKKIEGQLNREFKEGRMAATVNTLSGYSVESDDKKLSFHIICSGKLTIFLSKNLL